MENQIKLLDSEIESLKQLQQKYSDITSQFGMIEVERIVLNNQLRNLDELHEKLKTDYTAAQTDEQRFSAQLLEKYGVGSIDIESGTFIKVTQ
jgi:hypothetical protein